jgi:5'-nucleotidase / UDP-sugar diphosphatase
MKTKKANVLTVFLTTVFLFGAAAVCSAEPQVKKENPSEVAETIVGDIVADAMRDALVADVALINAGSIGTEVLPEKINEETLEVMVPYPSDIVVLVKLSGADIFKALEKSVSSLPRRNSGFLQVSGLTFSCDLNKKTGIRISNVRVNGEQLDPKTVYKVALTDFLSSGGSGYGSLKNGELVSEETLTLGDIVLKHAYIPGEDNRLAGGRIRIIKQENQ